MQKRNLNMTGQGSGYSPAGHVKNGNWWSGLQEMLSRWLNKSTRPCTQQDEQALVLAHYEADASDQPLLRTDGNVHYVDFQQNKKTKTAP